MAIQSVQTGFFTINNRATLSLGVDYKVTRYDTQGQYVFEPNNISFSCSRRASCIEGYVYPIFIGVNTGKELTEVQQNPNRCSGDYGHCGNLRGSLSECRCEILDRFAHPEIRRIYEEHVIRKVCNIIESQNKGAFILKLAIWAPGGLLGEEILLLKLFNRLRTLNASGVIKLFLIDKSYQGNIITASKVTEVLRNAQITTPPSLSNCTGNQGSIGQFLTDICGCLQPALTMEGFIFGSADSYLSRAMGDNNFRHDLLISADNEGTDHIMGNILSSASSRPDVQPITLTKTTGSALVCEVTPDGELENCYIPIDRGVLAPQIVYQKPKNSCVLV